MRAALHRLDEGDPQRQWRTGRRTGADFTRAAGGSAMPD
jgi:hypothetical protein